MEAVAKMCEECAHYINADCEGKPQAGLKKGKLPCKKYQLYAGEDLNSFGPDIVEPEIESEPRLDIDSEPVIPLRKNIKGGSTPIDVRKANFQRLSATRVNKAIVAIKLLGNLNNKYAYAFEPEDIQALRTMLENTIAKTFGQF